MPPVAPHSHAETSQQLRLSFAAQLPRRIEEIARQVRFLEAESWNPRRVDFLHRLVHSLSGSANSFGLDEVATVARPLEVNLARLIGRMQTPKTNELLRISEALAELLRVVECQVAQMPAVTKGGGLAQRISKKRIFLLHAVPEQARELQQVLHAQYEVQIFSQLEELKRACKESLWPDFILIEQAQQDSASDTALLEQLKQLRQLAPSFTYFILACPADDVAARMALYRAGANHCLAAPMPAARLLETLASLEPPAASQAYRILLIVRDDAKRQQQVDVLQAAGMQVRAVADAQQVQAHFLAWDAELIVIDSQEDACELASLLRDLAPDVNLVFQIPPSMVSSMAASGLHPLHLQDDAFLPPFAYPEQFIHSIKQRAQAQRERRLLQAQLAQVRNERAREQEALYQHAIVSISDLAGNIVFVNDKFCRISGYSRSELIGRNHRMLKSNFHQAEFFQDLWRSVCHDQLWHGEICNRNKEGGLYWLETTIVPMPVADGHAQQFLSIRTDISAQKEREKLINDAQRLSKLGNLGNMGNGPALVWSDLMADLLASKPDLQDGLSAEDFAWLDHPHHNAAGSAQLPMATRANLHAIPMPDTTTAASLEHQEKPDFLATMSQQMRAPLNAMLAYVQMIHCDKGMQEMATALQIGMQEIAKTGQHLLTLMNDVLELANLQTHNTAIKKAPVSVQALFNSCEAQATTLAAAHGMSVHFQVGDCLSMLVWADFESLKQALLILITNAIKYNRPHGKVQVNCQLLPANGHARQQPRLKIAVSDTGYGLSEEKIERLYTPFDRLGAEHGQVKGSGIGLLICRQLLQRMDAQIGVESTPGLGSTFCIELALLTPQQMLTSDAGALATQAQNVWQMRQPAWVENVSGNAAINTMFDKAQIEPVELDERNLLHANGHPQVLGDKSFAIQSPPMSPMPPMPLHQTLHIASNQASNQTTLYQVTELESAVKEDNMALSQRRIVLYIEDNAASQRLMHKVLAKRGDLEMVDAISAEIGLPLAAKLQPALVLLDINLPGLDGYQALQQLRAMPGLEHTPVIAVTANAMKGDAERGLMAGFTAYVAKPLDIEQFYLLLQRLLGPAEAM